MVKLDYVWQKFTARTYIAHDFAQAKDIGARISYDNAGLQVGVSFLNDNSEDEQNLSHYEFDAAYEAFELLELSTQISNIDDGQDETDDVKVYLMANYLTGFKLPVVGNFRPFLGVDTRQNLDENTIFFGLNFEPIPDGFIKIEYSVDSSELIDDRFDIQLAYIF